MMGISWESRDWDPTKPGDEGKTQVPGLGQVPTSGAADHRQEQANQGRPKSIDRPLGSNGDSTVISYKGEVLILVFFRVKKWT